VQERGARASRLDVVVDRKVLAAEVGVAKMKAEFDIIVR